MTLLEQNAGADLRARIAGVVREEVAAAMLAASESDSISAKNRALQKSHLILTTIRQLLEESETRAESAAPVDALVAAAHDEGQTNTPADDPTVLSTDHAVSQDVSWFVSAGQEALGPFDFPEMREMAFSGRLQSQTLVVRSGGDTWIEADQDEALRFMLHGAPAPAPTLSTSSTDQPREEPKRRGIRFFLKGKE